jgi:hypothetical protein
MSDGIPFRSRHALQWQIVLVDPALLRAAQHRLRATGPSHAIEQALRQVLTDRRPSSPGRPPDPRIH